MSAEVIELVQEMNMEAMETQLALQCAPLLTGLKMSNLLILPVCCFQDLMQVLSGTKISYLVLYTTEQKITILLYNKKELQAYLDQKTSRQLLQDMGYQKLDLDAIFAQFQVRYQAYIIRADAFPHEMGLLLGYPFEDILGFLQKDKKQHLYTGYWKVYDNLEEKKELFRYFELAKEKLIIQISRGKNMGEIIQTYQRCAQKWCAV